MVPVVLGSGNYTKIAPTNSFIDAQKFETPARLAEYLMHLDTHFDEYSKYFVWKSKFRVKSNDHNVALCKVCEAINDPTMPVKTYSNMKMWWRDQGQCKSKGTFPWSSKVSDSSWSLPSLIDGTRNLLDGAKQMLKDLRKSKVIV